MDEREETVTPDGTEDVIVDDMDVEPAPAQANQPYTLKMAISDVNNRGVRNDGKPLKEQLRNY